MKEEERITRLYSDEEIMFYMFDRREFGNEYANQKLKENELKEEVPTEGESEDPYVKKGIGIAVDHDWLGKKDL